MIFLWIPESPADSASVHFIGIVKLLANGVSTVFINSKPIFINGPRNLRRNLTYCTILGTCIFDDFLLTDELLTKSLGRLASYLSVNDNSCGKVVSLSVAIMFNLNLQVTTVALLVVNFKLSS